MYVRNLCAYKKSEVQQSRANGYRNIAFKSKVDAPIANFSLGFAFSFSHCGF